MNIKIEIIKLKDENIWNHHFSKDLLYGSKHLIIKERKNVKIEKINALKLYQSNAWMCTREMKICWSFIKKFICCFIKDYLDGDQQIFYKNPKSKLGSGISVNRWKDKEKTKWKPDPNFLSSKNIREEHEKDINWD